MLEVLHFYVSGFWTWLGITAGLAIVIQGVVLVVHALRGGKGK